MPESATYKHEFDAPRLVRLLDLVLHLIRDYQWWTLERLTQRVMTLMNTRGVPEADVLSCLRALRREEYGGHAVIRSRSRRGSGGYRYRLFSMDTAEQHTLFDTPPAAPGRGEDPT